MDEFIRYASIIFGENLLLWIAIGAVFILLVVFLIFRSIRKHKQNAQARKASPAILDNNLGNDEIAEKKPHTGLAAVMQSLHDEENDQQEEKPSTSDATNDNMPEIDDMNDSDDEAFIEELSIPRLSQSYRQPQKQTPATPEIKGNGISNDQGRQEAEVKEEEVVMPELQQTEAEETEEEKVAQQAKNTEDLTEDLIEDLAEVEMKMKALRELHDAGLIATEIYLLKTRELAKDL